jgi:hypothetical protein
MHRRQGHNVTLLKNCRHIVLPPQYSMIFSCLAPRILHLQMSVAGDMPTNTTRLAAFAAFGQLRKDATLCPTTFE